MAKAKRQPDHPEASPISGVVPPVEHRFKPGNPGGPGRKPGTVSIVDRLTEILEKDGGKVANALAEAGARAALKGDFRFWKEIVDRIDGKVLSQLDITSAGEQIKGYVGFDPDKDV